MPDDELTTAKVAALLRVDTSTVYRMAERGELRFRKTPKGHRRFERAQVEALAAGLEAGEDQGVGTSRRLDSLERRMARVERHLGVDDNPEG